MSTSEGNMVQQSQYLFFVKHATGVLPMAKSRSNNHSAINVNVDCNRRILVICFPIDSFIISALSSDSLTIISYGPSTLFTSVTQGNLLS
jgi:hypothetical protein